MTDALEQISGLLHEASETHHRVYRIVDGADDDWASWYAQWLIDLSELPDLLGARPGTQRAGLPARQPRQAIHGRGSRRTVGDLLRTPDPASFPAIRQLIPPRTPDGLTRRQHPVMTHGARQARRDPVSGGLFVRGIVGHLVPTATSGPVTLYRLDSAGDRLCRQTTSTLSDGEGRGERAHFRLLRRFGPRGREVRRRLG